MVASGSDYRELRQMTRFHTDLSQIMTSVMNRMESLNHMEEADKTVRKIVRNSLTRLTH
jgi:hypothetical protein